MTDGSVSVVDKQ